MCKSESTRELRYGKKREGEGALFFKVIEGGDDNGCMICSDDDDEFDIVLSVVNDKASFFVRSELKIETKHFLAMRSASRENKMLSFLRSLGLLDDRSSKRRLLTSKNVEIKVEMVDIELTKDFVERRESGSGSGSGAIEVEVDIVDGWSKV